MTSATAPAAPDPDDEAALERLRTLIRIPTMSVAPAERDEAAFDLFAATLRELYPLVHERLELERMLDRTFLFRWPGRVAGRASILMGHYDVVVADDEGWEHPPFAADVTGDGADRVLWGRGTLDDKGSVAAVLEAVERSLAAGVTPEHDVYLLFGHDEETAGTGAEAAARALHERGVDLGLVLDEGGAVIERAFPTVEVPVAVVGVSEKGTTNFTLTVEQRGGHASTPPADTATNRLARAITRLERHPFPAALNPVTARMIATIGAHARDPLRAVFTRAGLFRSLIVPVFARLSDETAAMVRTTMAVTQLSGSSAPNALAERAQAVVNVRIAVGSTVDEARRHLERSIADPLVRVESTMENDPARVSRMDGPDWQLLAETIVASYPGTVVTPYVQTGATDSRWFSPHSRSVYRFSPFEMSADERATLHAKNERMHVHTWFTGIRFFERLLRRL
ncbi:M20/M25/M40 family metallo-hydrolase [Herbiconiux sp. CPCC 205716]|uniref:M20/M25/M40 family metallo-hydrolase n=1 Tax=Herbiconiux gentiana TaxID=2970912 RepID=A0ABT2GJD5_9MICO|nr:M20/M25/M40 family metallo-hydrolase [Herbiconiux gentiana]MCS5715024.1 M20/M25/M40 family metallo-hydrolase [Herbiconiux gentiana]